jgi:hypothetical protein
METTVRFIRNALAPRPGAGWGPGCCNGFIMLLYINNVVYATTMGGVVNLFFPNRKHCRHGQGCDILLARPPWFCLNALE